MPVKIKWSNNLNLAELEFIPAPPAVLTVPDEVLQVISWMTAFTGHDRRLLRCDNNGALLTNDPWSGLNEVETAELNPTTGTPALVACTCPNKGVLIATSTQIVKIEFVRISGGASESIYLPPSWLYFFPNPVYSVTATVVPAATGTASYVGLTAYN